MTADIYKAMAQSIIDGEPEQARDLALKALELEIDPLQAINSGFIPGIEYIGEQFSCSQIFLPELVIAGEAMKSALSVLEPALKAKGQERESHGTVILATIQGDIHDIGKTLVGTMLASSGFRVIDLGVNVPIDTIISKARENSADIIAVSALLTTTMTNQRVLIERLNASSVRGDFKVMVGGAPVTREWSLEIDADGFSEDAIGAVAVAKHLVGV